MRLIEKVWFEQNKARFWLVPLLLPLTLLFWLISHLRRIAYKCKLLPSVKLDVPVIIVGNIGVGGNGKTPVVLWLIDVCRELGLTPGVVSRGYGGKAPSYPYLLTNSATVEETGDEPFMIYQRTGVDICVGADRIASGKTLIDKGCDILIADDGMQHYRLQRDLEFLVIDGNRRFGNELLLPAGPLREGLWRLKTVDYLINNGAKPRDNEMPMSLNATQITNCQTGEKVTVNKFIAENAEVNAIAGIGSPDRFFTTLRHLGFRLNEAKGFIDHHQYVLNDFEQIDNDKPLMMTEKDAVKCQTFAKDNWWYLSVDAHLPKMEENLLKKKIQTLVANQQG